jgi:nitric oxide reductase subunit B
MLGIGLMLFCFRVMRVHETWKEGPLKFSFWALNVGLMAMVTLSLLPVGLLQTWASVRHGYWYARSTECLGSPLMNALKWSRAFGDVIFAAGAVVLVIFIFGLALGYSVRKPSSSTQNRG